MLVNAAQGRINSYLTGGVQIFLGGSAVHRSRRAGAGAGVLTYFQYFAGAGAGAGVGSPPAALICAANYYRISAKKL